MRSQWVCRLAVVAAFFAVLPHATSAAAQTDETDPESKRAALSRQGLALADAGRWAEAFDCFQRAVALRSTPKGWFNLARAEEHVGRLASAERDYKKTLADAQAASETDVVAATEVALRDIASRVPHVRVRLAHPSLANTAHAPARLDGQPIGLDTSVSVDPGEHDITLHAEGAPDVANHVHVAERDQLDLPLDVPASVPLVTATAHPSLAGPIVAGGVGVLTAVVGSVLYFTGQSSYNSATANGQCPASQCSTQPLADQGNGGRASMIAGDVIIGVGVALVAAAVTWLVVTVTKTTHSVTANRGGLRVEF